MMFSFIVMAWYVVFHEREPGVYNTWDQAHAQVHGFKGNCYRKYQSREEAFQAFYGYEQAVVPPLHEPLLVAVDPPVLQPAPNDQIPLWQNSLVTKVVIIVVMDLLLGFSVWKYVM